MAVVNVKHNFLEVIQYNTTTKKSDIFNILFSEIIKIDLYENFYIIKFIDSTTSKINEICGTSLIPRLESVSDAVSKKKFPRYFQYEKNEIGSIIIKNKNLINVK